MHHLIVNPVAGRGRGLPLVARTVAALEDAGHEVVVHHTKGARHATELVACLEEGAVPVAFGGDGTVHEVMVACVRRDFAMGIVPVGSGDDFAFSLGFLRSDIDATLRTLVAGRERLVDVGHVGSEPFVNSFGTGFDADVARRIVHAPTFYRGLGKYLYGIVTALHEFRIRDVRVAVDGVEVHAGPSLLVTVQNGPRTGGSFLFAPEATPDDGRFDVVIAGGFGRLGTLGVLPSVMRGRHLPHPRIAIHRATQVGVRWSAPVAGHTEGEVLPLGSDFDVRMTPRSLRVIAPPPRG